VNDEKYNRCERKRDIRWVRKRNMDKDSVEENTEEADRRKHWGKQMEKEDKKMSVVKKRERRGRIRRYN
jgi:hypothetical protein